MIILNRKVTKPIQYLKAILEFFILPTFIAVAVFRVKYDNKSMVNIINLLSCFLAILIYLLTSHNIYNLKFPEKKKKCWMLPMFIILYFVIIIYFGKKIINESLCPSISPSVSDAYSIIALGISVSNNIIANESIAILECVVNLFYGVYGV